MDAFELGAYQVLRKGTALLHGYFRKYHRQKSANPTVNADGFLSDCLQIDLTGEKSFRSGNQLRLQNQWIWMETGTLNLNFFHANINEYIESKFPSKNYSWPPPPNLQIYPWGMGWYQVRQNYDARQNAQGVRKRKVFYLDLSRQQTNYRGERRKSDLMPNDIFIAL